MPYRCTSVCVNEFLDVCSVGYCHQGTLSSASIVTITLSHENVWHPLATCCLYITLLPYTCRSSCGISVANMFSVLDFQVRPVSLEGHHVEMWQLCSICTYAWNHMTVNTRALCHIYMNSIWNFTKFSIVNNRTCNIFFFFPPKMYLYLECRHNFSVVI